MKVLTATQARATLYGLIDDAGMLREPIQITGKRSSVVLVSEEDWRAIQETFYLVSASGMRESILEGLKIPLSKCRTKLDG